MAKLPGVGEQIQHELFDTLVRGIGVSTIGQKTKMFSPNNVGNPELTNMQEGGRLSNEESFLALSVRMFCQFFTPYLYRLIEDGAMWTFNVGNKPQLGPLPFFVAPCGGGLYGFDVIDNAHCINNGAPTWSSALKLSKPILIGKNEHFSIDMEFYTFQSYDAGVTPAINPLTVINADHEIKIIKCFLGGILERAVQ